MVAPARYRQVINQGVDPSYYETFSITLSDFGDAEGLANVFIPIRGPVMSFYLRNSGGGTVNYSFNGNTMHGSLATMTERLYSFRKVSKIWFAVPAGATTVELDAWMHT